MTPVVVASFESAQALTEAAKRLGENEFRVIDAFTPYPAALVDDPADLARARVLAWMVALAGIGTAVLVYAAEWFSATYAYPFNAGGRPLNSWPVFVLAPFEIGVLAAAAAGFAGFLWMSGLPRLNHPAFDLVGIEDASQDRFLLAIAAPGDEDDRRRALADILRGADVAEGRL